MHRFGVTKLPDRAISWPVGLAYILQYVERLANGGGKRRRGNVRILTDVEEFSPTYKPVLQVRGEEDFENS